MLRDRRTEALRSRSSVQEHHTLKLIKTVGGSLGEHTQPFKPKPDRAPTRFAAHQA